MTISERLRADDLLYNRGPDYEALRVKPSAVRLEAADTIDALVAALEFYANEENYTQQLITEDCGCCSYWHDEKIGNEGDQGGVARAALALARGGK